MKRALRPLLKGAPLSKSTISPALVVIDGNPDLRGALAERWPKVAVQGCTVHKLRDLEAHAPPTKPFSASAGLVATA